MVHFYCDGLKMVIPSSFDIQGEISLIVESNLYLKFEYQGDAFDGPGIYEMAVDFDLIRCYDKPFNGINLESTKSNIKGMRHETSLQPKADKSSKNRKDKSKESKANRNLITSPETGIKVKSKEETVGT